MLAFLLAFEANTGVKANRMRLTNWQVQNAKPVPGKTVKISDGGGLQLWVTPSGGKLWKLAYRFVGKQRKLSIGPYPTFSLKDARMHREEAKQQLRVGLDPSHQKQLAKLAKAKAQTNTFRAIAAEFVAKKSAEGRAASTIEKIQWLVAMASAALGGRPIADITDAEILKVLRGVEARGRRESARRLRSTISSIFRYAVATGRAVGDPTFALQGALTAPIVRSRAAIIEPRALGGLLRAIDGHNGTPEVRFGLQLLALTFVRPGELRGAKWEEVDFNTAVWTIPPVRMKGRRAHRVPLSRQALTVLRNVHAISGDAELILPGVRGRNRSLSENTFNSALRRHGYSKEEMTAHGFRSAASSVLNESGQWNADAIEAQLAHVERNSIRRAYARAEYWDERIRMMQWWSDRLDSFRSSRGTD
jgi:integrase